MSTSIYDFDVIGLDGSTIKMETFRGDVLLIVNTASQCGFTPQYKPLQELFDQYKDLGLKILGFPCNQFGAQEPGGSSEIGQFCESKFGITFPMFEKVDVNGDHADPLFKYLTEQAPGVLGTKAIKWNFTKFLVDRNGKVLQRYASTTNPLEIAKDIQKCLNEASAHLA